MGYWWERFEVKFIENKDSPFDVYKTEEMNSYGSKEIKKLDTLWRPYF